jgi:hypothetical protein
MFSMTRPKLTGLLAVAIVVALAGIAIAGTAGTRNTAAARAVPAVSVPTAAEVIAGLKSPDGVLRLDMAEDATRWVFSKDTANEDGLPIYGTSFVTQGYLYPEGTLTESNGVLADGRPEFPDKVIGQWTCRGWYIGEGHLTKTGPIVVTTQIYNLGGEYRLGGEFGVATITTEGYEIADVGVPVQRAITGGTGDFASAHGEQRQEMLGLNATEGVNLRIEIAVETA